MGGGDLVKRYLVLSLVFLLVPFFVAYSIPQQQEDDRVVKGWLITKAYDAKGNLLWTQVREDPFTLNFGRYISFYLEPGRATHTAVDTSGTSRSLGCGGTGENPFQPPYFHRYTFIAVGTGTNSFSINDYALTNSVLQEASLPSISVIGNKANVSISASFSFSSATTITEVGVITEFCDTSSYGRYFLIARDTISKSIPAGGTLAVTWIVEVNA